MSVNEVSNRIVDLAQSDPGLYPFAIGVLIAAIDSNLGLDACMEIIEERAVGRLEEEKAA